MKKRLEPQGIWEEYARGRAYNARHGLYETVKQNENFYIGRQWEGVDAPDLDKPVINILKRVVAYFIATIVSDDVAVQVSFPGGGDQGLGQALSSEVARVMEQAKLKTQNRDVIRNAAVDGDGAMYLRFEVEADPLNGGAIVSEVVDNTCVIFGNPQVAQVQRQPYILLALRRTVESVRSEMAQNGFAQAAENLKPDGEGESAEDGRVTVLVRLWKENGRVHAIKTTRECVVKPEVDLGLTLYPLAWMNWDRVRNSYHGQAAITGLVPNQIFINKLFAMGMEHVKKMAFPKVVFNEALLPEGWSNRAGEAIAVQGDPQVAVASPLPAVDMSNQVMMLIEKTIAYTRETMGATDAALGNVRPDNTSAIIAVQKSSAMPLELQRMSFYQFMEDVVRIILDLARVHYGVRLLPLEQGGALRFDFASLDKLRYALAVDIGPSTYWSELMQVETLDNLFEKGVIQDAETYLENVPDAYIRNRRKILDKLRARSATTSMGGMGNEAVPQVPYGAEDR